jgi:glycosyltransferase involved in cell wall biosynthesis
MKILMLSWEYPPRIVGGISRVVYDLAQRLGENGNEVHVITCMDKNTKEFEKDKNVYVHRVYTVGPDTKGDFLKNILHMNFAMIERATEVINQIGKFDIIHAHDWLVAFCAKTLKHAYKIPLVCTIHATEHGRNNGIYNDMQKYIHDSEWWLTYESWKVICNSDYMKNEIKNIWGLPESKIRVVFNGVDINKFNGIEKDMNFRRKYAMDNEKIKACSFLFIVHYPLCIVHC